MKELIGYLPILIYAIMLLGIALKRKSDTSQTVKQFIFANKNIGTGVLTCSIFSSWIWATSVIGATEATLLYGFSGGIAYVGGGTAGFIGMMIIIRVLKRTMGSDRFVTGFIKYRFSEHSQSLFLIFSVLVASYVILEQAVGLGLVFSTIFGISFKISAFIVMMIGTAFATKVGMGGILKNDVINFFLIIFGFGIMLLGIINSSDFINIQAVLNYVENTSELGGFDSSVFAPMTVSAVKYMMVAVVVGLAQSALDPIHYLKASIAKTEKIFIRAYMIGGVLIWSPFVMAIAFVLGYISLQQDDSMMGSNFGKILADLVYEKGNIQLISIAFACFILCIVMTTIINGLMGIFALASVEIFDAQVREKSDDVARIRFGKMFTWLAGIFCGLIAISLENISLLSIDIFSGIFFSAPCAVLIMGIALDKKLGNTGIVAVLAGIVTGLGAWIYLEDSNTDWFYGTLISFLLPILILALVDTFSKERFNFVSLKHEE